MLGEIYGRPGHRWETNFYPCRESNPCVQTHSHSPYRIFRITKFSDSYCLGSVKFALGFAVQSNWAFRRSLTDVLTCCRLCTRHYACDLCPEALYCRATGCFTALPLVSSNTKNSRTKEAVGTFDRRIKPGNKTVAEFSADPLKLGTRRHGTVQKALGCILPR
jgi:hypothetical protein